jgi:Flp pilus assembly pilin Flp
VQNLFVLVVRGAALLARVRHAARLWREEHGQDVIEYAMLAAFIGVAGILVLRSMNATIFDTYSSLMDPTIGAPSLWEPGAPMASSGGGS